MVTRNTRYFHRMESSSSSPGMLTTDRGNGCEHEINSEIKVRKGSDGGGVIGGISVSKMLEHKLFVGGLSWQTTPEILKKYFQRFGTVTGVHVPIDLMTMRSRGFGFVVFSDESSLQIALAFPSHFLNGSAIDVKPARERQASGIAGPRGANNKIFVGGISQATTSDDFKKYFSMFGQVKEARLMVDHATQRNRGFGFVTMEDEASANHICQIHYHAINGKKVECRKSEPKGSGKLIPIGTRPPLHPTSSDLSLSPVDVGSDVIHSFVSAVVAATTISSLVGANYHYSTFRGYRYTPYPTFRTDGLAAAFNNLGLGNDSSLLQYPSFDVSGLQNLNWSRFYDSFK